MKKYHKAFKITYPEIVSELITSIKIDFASITKKNNKVNFISGKALWDTGATVSVITPEFAKKLKLIPIGKTTVLGINSKEEVNKYLIDIILPNEVLFSNLEITESDFCGADILIGMDIIQNGDFSISNTENKTVFSFCIPPFKERICLYEKAVKTNLLLDKELIQ